MKIIKRDGRIVDYDRQKIAVAIEKANRDVIGKEKIDKYNLLKLFNEVFRNNTVAIDSDDSYRIDKSLVSIREDFKYKVPSYKEMLLEMKEWIDSHRIYTY